MIYSKESKFAIHEIKKLEECGILHKSLKTLIPEVQKQKQTLIDGWNNLQKKSDKNFSDKFVRLTQMEIYMEKNYYL